MINYISQVFSKDAPQAQKIVQCESGGNPDRFHTNFQTYDVGLFQINSIHSKEVESMYNLPFLEAMLLPVLNINYAYHLFKTQGWNPWKYCSKRST